MRSEWDEAKEHDVLFLLTIRPPDATELARMRTQCAALNPMELYGLTYVRGLEVIEVKDEGDCSPPPNLMLYWAQSPQACQALRPSVPAFQSAFKNDLKESM